MRIIFMGTPGFSATILEDLISTHEVVAVFTRPDAVRGRGKELIPSPVRQIALKAGIPTYTPKTLRDPEMHMLIESLHPDAICVAAYGMILPVDVLRIPRYGCLNVHASLLPRWRGAAPIERAILAGDDFTGVCVMRMEEGLDTGDYCICRETQISCKRAPALIEELSDLGARALLTALAQIEDGVIEWTPQDGRFVTYADKLEKRELFWSPRDKARTAQLKMQASSPAHPVRCRIAKRDVTIIASAYAPSFMHEDLNLQPGAIKLFQKGLFLGFLDEPLEILEVKPEGKRAMSGKDFAAGIKDAKTGLVCWEALHV